MNKFKLARLVACVALCLTMFGGLISQQVVRAQPDEQVPPPEEKIELETKYPIRSGPSDTAFTFEVDLSYTGGEEPLLFELSAEGPPDWYVRVQESAHGQEEIPALMIEAGKTYPDKVTVTAVASFWLYPEPGDYTVRLEAAAGDIKGSIELTARITDRYGFTAQTGIKKSGSWPGFLDIKATAGKESHFPIIITNTGTGTLDKVTFSSSKPSGIAGEEWSITFEPDKIEALSPGDQQEVEVTITPPAKVIAGDYPVTLRFQSDPRPPSELPELPMRVSVATPTKWGWIGAGIVVAVIAGLVIGFRKLGRR